VRLVGACNALMDTFSTGSLKKDDTQVLRL